MLEKKLFLGVMQIITMRLWLMVFALVLVVLSGCIGQESADNEIGEEHIGGKYNLTLIPVEGGKMIRYEVDGRVVEPDQMLPDGMRPGLDWLRQNSPDESVVLSWWDYGHAIRAYGEREPVVDAPSREILVTTVAKHIGKNASDVECSECVSHAIIQDVADALLSEGFARTKEVMVKYKASYLYVHAEDQFKSLAMQIALGNESVNINNTILDKAIKGEEIIGMDLVFEDNTAKLYALSP